MQDQGCHPEREIDKTWTTGRALRHSSKMNVIVAVRPHVRGTFGKRGSTGMDYKVDLFCPLLLR